MNEAAEQQARRPNISALISGADAVLAREDSRPAVLKPKEKIAAERSEIGAMATQLMVQRRAQMAGTITAADFDRIEQIIEIAMGAKPVIGALARDIVPRSEG